MITNSRSDLVDVNFQLEFLICTLLVLAPTSETFRRLNFQTHFYISIKEQTFILNNLEDVESVLNLVALRRFSYNLLKPIVYDRLILPDFIDNESKKDLEENTVLLQKFLDKYRFFFKHYFLLDENNKDMEIKDKKINSFAMESLFLLVGI